MEQILTGGNMHEHAVRIGAPRVHGVDEQGREILDYVDGELQGTFQNAHAIRAPLLMGGCR